MGKSIAEKLWGNLPYREEQLGIKIGTKENLTKKQREICRHLGAKFPNDWVEGDDFQITYKIDIQYFGEITARLKDIEDLLDSGMVIRANSNEFYHGKCLIQDVLLKLEKLEHRFK